MTRVLYKGQSCFLAIMTCLCCLTDRQILNSYQLCVADSVVEASTAMSPGQTTCIVRTAFLPYQAQLDPFYTQKSVSPFYLGARRTESAMYKNMTVLMLAMLDEITQNSCWCLQDRHPQEFRAACGAACPILAWHIQLQPQLQQPPEGSPGT